MKKIFMLSMLCTLSSLHASQPEFKSLLKASLKLGKEAIGIVDKLHTSIPQETEADTEANNDRRKTLSRKLQNTTENITNLIGLINANKKYKLTEEEITMCKELKAHNLSIEKKKKDYATKVEQYKKTSTHE